LIQLINQILGKAELDFKVINAIFSHIIFLSLV
jgi:hypothetical protein